MHPTMIFMAQLRRWVHIADSTRPESSRKCQADKKDMETLLRWAVNCGFKIDLDGYIGKEKSEFHGPLQKLYSRAPSLRSLLNRALKPEDLAIVRSRYV
jgi:hypothetical protein